MKTKMFSIFFIFLLFSTVYLLAGFAQEYTRFSLPEAADSDLKEGRITAIQYSRDGRLLAIASSIGIWLYDTDSGEEVPQLTRHIGGVSSVSLSPDGKTLAGGSGREIRLWDVKTGVHKRTLKGHTTFVWSISFSPDGKTLASGSRDKTIRLWDVKTGMHKRTIRGHTDEILSVSFSPDGEMLASGGWDATIRLWDVKTGALKRIIKGHTATVNSVSFSPDGKTLASTSGKEIHLLDTKTGAYKRKLKGHTGTVNSVSFSPDGGTLASAGWDKTIGLWDAKTGAIKRTLEGHTSNISSVSFSPDGKTLTSASGREIHLWDLSTIVYSARARMFSTRADREGFIWGIGVGTGMASYTQSLVEYWGDAYEGPRLEARGTESAFITNFRMGHGLTDQVLFYYTSRIAWIPLRNLYRDTVIANGTAGLGVTIYPYYKSNFYLSGSVGLSTLATWFPPLELEKARPTGIAVSAGIGYEFFPHSSIDLTVSFGNASRTDIDEKNHIELTNEVVTVLLTLNGLAY